MARPTTRDCAWCARKIETALLWKHTMSGKFMCPDCMSNLYRVGGCALPPVKGRYALATVTVNLPGLQGDWKRAKKSTQHEKAVTNQRYVIVNDEPATIVQGDDAGDYVDAEFTVISEA